MTGADGGAAGREGGNLFVHGPFPVDGGGLRARDGRGATRSGSGAGNGPGDGDVVGGDGPVAVGGTARPGPSAPSPRRPRRSAVHGGGCDVLLLLSLAWAVDSRALRVPGAADVPVWDIQQDEAGWIWMATQGGPVRFDGEQALPLGGPEFRLDTIQVVQASGEQALVRARDRSAWWVDRTQARPVPGPDGAPLTRAEGAEPDGRGGRWWLLGEELWRERSGWTPLPAPAAGPPQALWDAPEGLWVATASALLHLDDAGRELGRLPLPAVQSLSLDEAGSGWAGGARGEVWRVERGEARLLADEPVFVSGIASPARETWAVSGHTLLQLGPTGVRVRIILDEGSPNTGPILLDREGGLWVGTYLGPRLRPSPDTLWWTRADGLSDPMVAEARYTDGRVWMSSWAVADTLDPDGAVRRLPLAFFGWPFARDRAGRHWGFGIESWAPPVVGHVYPLEEPFRPGPGMVDPWLPEGLDPAQDGGLWLPARAGIGYMPPGGGPLRWWAGPGGGLFRALETSDRRLLVFRHGAWCETDPRALLAGEVQRWACHDLGGRRLVRQAVEVDGRVWLGGEDTGLLVETPRGLVRVQGSASLPTDVIARLAPSPRGGVWVVSPGATLRARPKGEGWEVLERLDAWNGLPQEGGSSVDEQPDGSAWLATSSGLIYVPAHARGRPAPPPTPVPVRAEVDGRAADPAAALYPAWPHNQVELRFTTASYRDRSRLRWRTRRNPGEAWSTPTPDARLRLVDLPAGTWAPQAQASLDGEAWSAPSTPVLVEVRRPWYLSAPALSGLALGLAGGAYGLARLREAAARRVEAERRRIAMDLHDELGSGLGTVAMLAGLAADETLDEEARRDVAGQVAETAQSLGDTLGEIVWSLRRDAGSPASLARLLTDRGTRLFADGQTRFTAEIPERWPAVSLSLSAHRTAQLVALEALGNAARHARGRNVWLRIEVGRRWWLTVEDDGRGLYAGSSNGGTGTGLVSMRARAEAIGADLEVGERPGGGTVVRLGFDPHAKAPAGPGRRT